jgi:gas vesicle protein
MADMKKRAKKARKQLEHLDLDLSALKDKLPKDFDPTDLHLMRKREDEAASTGFVSGLLLGVLVGAILALIFAPKRGDETRELVAHTATDLKDKAVDLVHQAKSDGEGEELAAKAEEAVGAAEQKADDASVQVEKKINETTG